MNEYMKKNEVKVLFDDFYTVLYNFNDGAYMCVKENIERKKNMDTTRIKYYIYDIDEHELVAEVYDPYYLGIVVEGFGRNEINMQIQPVVVDTEDCKSDE